MLQIYVTYFTSHLDWPPGTIIQVKIVAGFSLINKTETDWKLLDIHVDDPLAPELNGLEDVESVMPGLLAGSLNWFKAIRGVYGVRESDIFVEDGKFSAEYAFGLIEEYHEL